MKERLFVGKAEDKEMCGLLIYTASGDAEGSLGGLVERAKPGLLEDTIISAIRKVLFVQTTQFAWRVGNEVATAST